MLTNLPKEVRVVVSRIHGGLQEISRCWRCHRQNQQNRSRRRMTICPSRTQFATPEYSWVHLAISQKTFRKFLPCLHFVGKKKRKRFAGSSKSIIMVTRSRNSLKNSCLKDSVKSASQQQARFTLAGREETCPSGCFPCSQGHTERG